MDFKEMLYYIDLVRSQLLKYVNPSPHELHDEMVKAFAAFLPQSDGQ